MSVMNTSIVAHIAVLANIPITEEEEKKLADGFTTTLQVVDSLMTIDTHHIQPTHQVTELENVWREDAVDQTRTFSQEDALANAASVHDGFFVVPQLIEQ